MNTCALSLSGIPSNCRFVVISIAAWKSLFWLKDKLISPWNVSLLLIRKQNPLVVGEKFLLVIIFFHARNMIVSKIMQFLILNVFGTSNTVQITTFCSFGNILKWSWDSLSNTSHIHTPFFTQQCNFLPLIHRSSVVCVEDPKKTH